MKYKKELDCDQQYHSINGRNVFTEGMTLPVGVVLEYTDYIYSSWFRNDEESFGTNRKRILKNYWKEIYNSKNNEIIVWMGSDEV